MITFDVSGTPAPQGSKVRTQWGMRESSAAVMPWREAVKAAVLVQHVGHVDGPVQIVIVFRFQRPKAHYGTGRNAATLKPSAPPHPTSRRHGDIDKLARSTLDALTDSGVITDDSHVVTLTASKTWTQPGETPGAHITITPAATPQGETHA